MEKAISEIVEMYKKINELREKFNNEFDVINIRVDHSFQPTYQVNVQYEIKKFFNKFSNFEVTERGCGIFPYEAFFIDGAVKHFAILSEFEYKKHVLKEAN